MAGKMPQDHAEIDIEPLAKKIGERIRQLRVEAGYSSYESFAWEYGINRMSYWKMEQGTNFTLKSLMRILQAHEVNLSTFFDGIDS